MKNPRSQPPLTDLPEFSLESLGQRPKVTEQDMDDLAKLLAPRLLEIESQLL